MEIINITKIKNEVISHNVEKIVKKIPLLTEHAMVSIIFIPTNDKTAQHFHSNTDEINFIVEGSGEVVVNGETQKLEKEMVVVVPRKKPFQFVTRKENMIMLSFRPINKLQKKSKQKVKS